MEKESIKCHMVSWDEAYRLSKILSRKIIKSVFKPDIIIGIARGGLVPVRTICDFLNQKDIASIKTEHWGIADMLDKARIKYSLPKEADISGKSILVVDDVADNGGSLSIVMEYLKEKNPLEIRTAVLHYKTCSTFVPDYWGEKIDEWNWLIYPWEVFENISDFIDMLLVRPMTNEEIRKSLKRDYDIDLKRKDLLEMLNDMSLCGKIRKGNKGKKILWENAQTLKR